MAPRSRRGASRPSGTSNLSSGHSRSDQNTLPSFREGFGDPAFPETPPYAPAVLPPSHLPVPSPPSWSNNHHGQGQYPQQLFEFPGYHSHPQTLPGYSSASSHAYGSENPSRTLSHFTSPPHGPTPSHVQPARSAPMARSHPPTAPYYSIHNDPAPISRYMHDQIEPWNGIPNVDGHMPYRYNGPVGYDDPYAQAARYDYEQIPQAEREEAYAEPEEYVVVERPAQRREEGRQRRGRR